MTDTVTELREKARIFREEVERECRKTGADWDLARCRTEYARLKELLRKQPEEKKEGNFPVEDTWERDFHPACIRGHDPGGCYWIMPVYVRERERISCYDDVQEQINEEISIPMAYFEPLLLGFFEEAFDEDLYINQHRFSCAEHPEGVFVKGFTWYSHYNFFTCGNIRKLTTRLENTAESLRSHDIRCLGERQLLHLLVDRMRSSGTEDIPDGMMDRIRSFYIEVEGYLLEMMEKCKDALVIAAAFL